MANALDLNLPPNALRAIAQGQASGRLSVLQNHYAGQPDGAGNLKLVAAGKPTTVQSHPHPTMLKSVSASANALGVPEAEPIVQSPRATLHQSPRVKVRARSGKSKAKGTAPHVARGPSDDVMPAMQRFRWATATAEEISRLPGLNGLPIVLINLILPRLRAFVEEFESSTHSNSRAAGHGQNSPAERPQLPPVARSIGLSLSTPQPEPSLLMEQLEPAFLVAGQLSEPDESPASMPMFEELRALQQQDKDGGPEPTVEGPPSAALERPLDPEYRWGMEASQTRNSLTLPTQEDIERLLCALSEGSNGPSELGDGTAWGGVGTGAVAQFDFGTFLDGWEGFARL